MWELLKDQLQRDYKLGFKTKNARALLLIEEFEEKYLSKETNAERKM